jgi:phage gp46-like protein
VTDIALIFDNDSGHCDIALDGADLATDDGLETAVLLSLFLDRRADEDDEIPSGDGDRRGWYGDFYSDIPGDQTGSRLWLLGRSPSLPEIPLRAKGFITEALQWMKDDGVTNRIDVVTSLESSDPAGELDTLYFAAAIYDPLTGEAITFKYRYNWVAQSFKKAA